MTTAIRFHRVTDPTGRHAFYSALYAADSPRYVAAYERDAELNIEPFEFTDPAIVSETEAWLAEAAASSNRPPVVMVGSTENGHWVNWNLTRIPRPPAPSR